MNFSTYVCNQLASRLALDGFKRGGRLIYKITNELCFCFHIQIPSDLVHVHFFILPLYMPSERIHFTYGNRLCYAIPSSPKLYKSASEEQIAIWCDETYEILTQTVLPFFDKIDSPKKLSRFLRRPWFLPHKFFPVTKAQVNILKLYTYAYRRKQIFAFFANLRYQLSASFSNLRTDEEIPFHNGKFSAPAMSEEDFKANVLKVKHGKDAKS